MILLGGGGQGIRLISICWYNNIMRNCLHEKVELIWHLIWHPSKEKYQ